MRETDGNAGRTSTREAILTAASELFDLQGVQSVTTRQIAERVGISQPSIYAHFSSMQEIQDEVSARVFSLLEEATATEGDDPQAQLLRAIRGYFDFGLGHPEAYRIAFMIDHPGVETAESKEFASLDHPGPRAYARFTSIMARVRPDLAPEALELRTQSLWACLHGLVALMIARPEFPWADRERLVAEHSRLAMRLALA